MLFLLHSGLKEASDIVLYLKPLKISLEEMEQADFTLVHGQEKTRSCGAGVGICRGPPDWGIWEAAGFLPITRKKVPGSPLVDVQALGMGRLRHTRVHLSPAPNLHRQGAGHHLLHLGHLRALQHTLQDHRHPAGVLQPDHGDGDFHDPPVWVLWPLPLRSVAALGQSRIIRDPCRDYHLLPGLQRTVEKEGKS